MNKTLSVLVLVVGIAGQAAAAPIVFTDRLAFEAAGTIVQTTTFDGLVPPWMLSSDPYAILFDPWQVGEVTYDAGVYLLTGIRGGHTVLSDYTPEGTIQMTPSHPYSLFGFDTASHGGLSMVVLTTNRDTYLYPATWN